MPGNPTDLYSQRIALLESFKADLESWFRSDCTDEQSQLKLRSRINRQLQAARAAVLEVGLRKTVTVGPPPAIGGLVFQNIDPFSMVFESPYGSSVIPCLVDLIEEALGVYEHLRDDTGLVRVNPPAAIDLEAAIERTLRPAFRRSPPTNECDVQDAVENIIAVLGLEYHREKESAVVGPRAFKPDFTFPLLDLALEVKLTSPKHSLSEVQEEIAADIAGYGTRWKRLMFVVYDLGQIDDPHAFRRENMQTFGVTVVVVKQ